MVNIIYKLNSPFVSKREFHIGVEWDNVQHNSFATFPDEMIDGIVNCEGFCDLQLNENGTEVVSFTALEMPYYMKKVHEPSQLDIIDAKLTYIAMMTDLTEVL